MVVDSDFHVDVGGAGAAGVSGPEDLLAGLHEGAIGDGGAVAVAVGPADAVRIDDGDADAAGVAASAAVCWPYAMNLGRARCRVTLGVCRGQPPASKMRSL